jgi:hypothetical protein
VLPRYREAFQMAAEDIFERGRRAEAERIAGKLAGILGCKVAQNNGAGSDFQIHPRNLRNGYADIKVSEHSNEVAITLRWISPELAERLCAVL